jgi:ABC-2 type transport system ATP-binding protein
MIEVRGLTKNYGSRPAVRDLSFSVKKGEVVGFLGPNGAGKTTTMKIITGFMAPSSGSVEVAGFDVFEEPIEVKRRIGYLPETPPVYGDMRVDDYLRFVANLKGVEKSRIPSLVEAAIAKTDLGSVRSRVIQNLSKGYRQRVGISQAIVSDPEVLILDEPTVGLDPRQVAEIRHLIKELAGQHTIIISTHILPEVQASCQRIIIINQGEIVAQDTFEGLSRRMTSTGRVHLRVRKASDGLIAALRAVPGVKGVATLAGGPGGEATLAIDTDGSAELSEKLAGSVVTLGAGLLEIRTETFNLEDVFLKLTSSEEQQGARA